jgi:ABC-type dipeptide/oligopeptide/nickel transport system permease subunit
MRLGGRAAIGLLALLVIAAIVGQHVWTTDPFAQEPAARLRDPSLAHPFGTDNFGRDILARLVLGARWSLSGAALVCCGTTLLGFGIGALAASGPRILDNVIGRSIEALLAMPGLVLALALSAILGASFENLIVALILTGWPGYARLSRALILKERNQQYVDSAVALGADGTRIVVRHILPNVIGPAAVLATGDFGKIILGLAALSFLGLGMQPPTPEWGQMINDARGYFQTHPWQMIAPGLCIAATVLTVNLIGDAVRDKLDPRTKTSSG